MSHPIVIGFVVDLFNVPASQRQKDEEYSRDRNVKPTSVWTALQRDFAAGEIREAVLDCLRQTANADWTGRKIDGRQVFATGCCFDLVNAVPDLSLDRETTAEFVLKFNSLGAYYFLGSWVARYLDEADLLDVLTRGLRTADNDAARSSCLAGAELYRWKVRHRAPIEKLEWRLTDFEMEVRCFRDATDPIVVECAADARSASWALRRHRPDLKKAAHDAFTTYRVEDGVSVTYVIEREDGFPSVRVPRLEVIDRTLYVDFEDVDPAVLPEDAPSLIEYVLLGRYAEGIYSSSADQAVFTNLGDKKRLTVTRPIPRDVKP